MITISEIWDSTKDKNNVYITNHKNVVPEDYGCIIGHYKVLNHLGGNIFICLLLSISKGNSKGLVFSTSIDTFVGNKKEWRVFNENDWQAIEASINENRK